MKRPTAQTASMIIMGEPSNREQVADHDESGLNREFWVQTAFAFQEPTREVAFAHEDTQTLPLGFGRAGLALLKSRFRRCLLNDRTSHVTKGNFAANPAWELLGFGKVDSLEQLATFTSHWARVRKTRRSSEPPTGP